MKNEESNDKSNERIKFEYYNSLIESKYYLIRKSSNNIDLYHIFDCLDGFFDILLNKVEQQELFFKIAGENLLQVSNYINTLYNFNNQDSIEKEINNIVNDIGAIIINKESRSINDKILIILPENLIKDNKDSIISFSVESFHRTCLYLKTRIKNKVKPNKSNLNIFEKFMLINEKCYCLNDEKEQENDWCLYLCDNVGNNVNLYKNNDLVCKKRIVGNKCEIEYFTSSYDFINTISSYYDLLYNFENENIIEKFNNN